MLALIVEFIADDAGDPDAYYFHHVGGVASPAVDRWELPEDEDGSGLGGDCVGDGVGAGHGGNQFPRNGESDLWSVVRHGNALCNLG